MGKTYNQFCPIANALDLVGERWALLIVRELGQGALRYTDLLDRLGGCSTNILAQRLRDLEANGLVARRLIPPPTPATLYELTPAGEGLRPVLRELALWGARTLGPPAPGAVLPPGWLARATTVAAAPVAPTGCYRIVCGDERVVLRDGALVDDDLASPEVTLEGTPAAVHGLLVGGSLDGLVIAGSQAAARRLAASLAQSPAASRRSTSNASRTSASVVR